MISLALTGAAYGSTSPLGAATGFNVFVFSNFTETGTDAQGSVAVGGNFAPANGGSFTIAGASSDPAGTYDLVVGGSFTETGNSMGGGSAWIGGNMSWSDPSLPNNAYVVGNFTNSSSGGTVGGTVYYGGTYSSGDTLNHQAESGSSMTAPINFAGAQTSLDALSTSLAQQTANGTVSSAYGTYTLTGTSSTLNVFDLTASSYSGATINISAPSTSTVVINVAGSSVSFNGGSINLSGVSSSNVIFNFNSASTLLLSDIGFNGSILAPSAAFTGTYGDIDGQLIAYSAAGTTQINEPLFTGALPELTQTASATPEPGTWLLLIGGGLAVAGLKMRRRREA